MLSHITIACRDFADARAFYEPVMEALGLQVLFLNEDVPFIAFSNAARDRPWLFVSQPELGASPSSGNGQMAALNAPDRESVDAAFEAAMLKGGQSEGAPGLRPHYHDDFYAAYVRDPDGNKLCFVCHEPVYALEPA